MSVERPETVLEVDGAAKSYGEVEALRRVDLELVGGEWLGLLGPNGAGKTTLVRAVAGRARLDAGRIELFGRPAGHPGRCGPGGLGIVPQEIALYPDLTAEENLQAFGALHRLGRRELRDRVAWALDWTGLAERSGERVDTYSGGMKRRLNLACGVLHRPRVLLLDEPTVGVDPQSRQRIWEMLTELHGEGTSLLLTTHQLDEAQQVCERIVILDHGQVIAGGTLSELIAQTVGDRRRVTLTLADPLAEPFDPPGLRLRQAAEGRSLAFDTADAAGDLSRILAEIGRRQGQITDVHLEAPSLQAVFLHFTGRELRE